MKRIVCFLFLSVFASSAWAANSDQFNFRFSPIGVLVGAVNVSLDYAANSDWTVGPTGSYWKLNLDSDPGYTSKYDITAYGFGVRANWFRNGIYTDGLYVGPSLQYANVTLDTSDVDGDVTGTASGLFAGCLVGYGWFWDSFNIMLGGGLSVGLGDTKVTVKDSSGTELEVDDHLSGFEAEFSLGWTF